VIKQGGSTTFGRRKEPHTVIIARGDEIRHFTIKPWIATLAGSAVAAVAIGYLLATSYLVLRDDLIGATVARQARMQQAYEDRISALRTQVDRITSRQLLDQQLVESKVSELLDRQSKLSQRHGQIGPLLDRASEASPAVEAKVKAEVKAELAPAPSDLRTIGASTALWATRDRIDDTATAADRADKLFVAINQSLRSIEAEQMDKVSRLADDAYQTADAISQALADAGVPLDNEYGKQAVGGPLVPLDPSDPFDAKVKELDDALTTLDSVKAEAARLPIANPAPGRAVTSTFGPRRDPLLGTLAMHSGMDFRSSVGSPVRATGIGKVVHAGFNGGYGRMVEISHGDGLTTRFAHMSQILVKEGDIVSAGDLLGKSGNSGRSTGPHLHYEVRRNGEALNPLPFIKVGRKIGRYLIRS
jgi:murein DD-endopeptidase MepM/ murein hydrolase activator NlpD